jgi:hypothetical protein
MLGHALFAVTLTYILKRIPNQSNFRKELIIPVIVVLMTKYTLGDFDKGFQWSLSDAFFGLFVLAVSYVTIKI